jgi:hypothetical protein
LDALSDIGKINYYHDKYACPECLRIALHSPARFSDEPKGKPAEISFRQAFLTCIK